ncbi:carboxymuconolactone decarboxylase family protein [Peribacillus frigoritolerans]|uniref:carboxymuconolactone decarboxylase family protein n=1 Tax=Peribacillus frigoritolerans TaxID=450367 RepID=UPI00105A5109|nr:carboxymuconolactone decarboxylase family protein [Peribacillus frigoritolerans]TDL80152.1 alkylhydroperoxidase [Peribacillus frigoritolerans]
MGFYAIENIQLMKRFPELAPDLYQSYIAFSKAVLSEGHLTRKEKEIIAVAVSHATECPYCIDFHTKKAKKAGASLEELFEAVMVAAAIEAGGAYAHRTQMHRAYDGKLAESFYSSDDLANINTLQDLSPEIQQTARAFFSKASEEGKLTAKLKQLIGVAVAHTSECPYCIAAHTAEAKNEGCSKEELAEAVMTAALLRSGGAVTHAVNMLQSYEQSSEE